MADIELKTRIILRNDTKTSLEASTVVLLKGEVAIEIGDDGTAKFKVGNGGSMYKELPYSTFTPNEVSSILSSYIKNLSVSGTIITYTKGDGTTGTITTQDTTYSAATTSNDGLMTSADKLELNTLSNKILVNTTEKWKSQTGLTSVKDTIYIYSDYKQTTDGKNIPGIKIGDGNAFLVDLPFIDAKFDEHVINSIIHITQEDRNRWDNKVRCYIDENDSENLCFTTN